MLLRQQTMRRWMRVWRLSMERHGIEKQTAQEC
jgi:hypothetical protein